jgi:putative ABC transport system permease protein
MIFIKIALLYIRRHLKRSILIIFAVMVAVIVMEFIGGMMDGMKKDFYTNLLVSSGHVQIHDSGYAKRIERYSLKYLISDPDALITRLKENREVVAAEKLVHFGALLIKGDKNVAMEGHGIEPDTAFYLSVRKGIADGGFLPSRGDVLVSKRICKLLGTKEGEHVQVLVEDAHGSPYYLDYVVAGTFDTDVTSFDDVNFFMRYDDASDLLDTGGRATEVRINLADSGEAKSFEESISGSLAASGLVASTWEEIHGSLVVLIKVFDFFMIIINLFVVVVVATVITNAILMNQFARIREFGTVRAVGLKKRQLFSLILSEGVIEGVMGSIAGIVIGIPIVLYFEAFGLRFGDVMEAFGFSAAIHFAVTATGTLVNFIFGVLVSTVGSLYAAFVCSRMDLVRSLNYA